MSICKDVTFALLGSDELQFSLMVILSERLFV